MKYGTSDGNNDFAVPYEWVSCGWVLGHKITFVGNTENSPGPVCQGGTARIYRVVQNAGNTTPDVTIAGIGAQPKPVDPDHISRITRSMCHG